MDRPMIATAQITVELRPWGIPRGAAYAADQAVALEALTQEALDNLAGQWLEDLYKAANKADPWTYGPIEIVEVREARHPINYNLTTDAEKLRYLREADAHCAEGGPLGEAAGKAALEIALEALERCQFPPPAPKPIFPTRAPSPTGAPGYRDLFRDLEYLGQAEAHADEGPLGEPAARSILEIALYWLKRAAS